MLILDATTKKLQLNLGESATTELDWVTTWADSTDTGLTEGSSDGTSNDTTAVDIVASPSASTRRIIKEISVYNGDNIAHIILILLNVSGTTRVIYRVNLNAGETFMLSKWGIKGEDGVDGADGTDGTVSNQWDIDPTPDSDHSCSGIRAVLTANENQAFGDICYIDSDGEAHLGDADAIATSSCVIMCADATISANATGNYLLLGIARDDTWTWTVGGLIYLTVTGTTGNTLSQTAPSGTDDVVQIVGVATHADRMLFNPSLVQVEHT